MNQNAELHVEECSGKKDRRRTCDVKIENGMFGVKGNAPWIRVLHTAQGIKSWVGTIFSPVRGIENRLARKKSDYHEKQISDNKYLDKSSRTFDGS